MSNKNFDNNEKKKGWRPGRNPLTFILLVLIVAIVFFAIWIPSDIIKNKKAGDVSPFQDYANITNVSTYYNEDEITWLDAGEFEDFGLKFYATQYEDKYDSTYKKGTTLASGDELTFSLTLSADSADGFATFSGSTYFAYAAVCIAQDWIGDYADSNYASFTPSNLTNGTPRCPTLTSTVSYPAKAQMWGPFYKTVETPDIYLYLVYNTTKQKQKQYIIKYTYKDYMTTETSGAVVK